MGVEKTDFQLLEKCLEFLEPSIVLQYIEKHTPVNCVKLACGFDSLAVIKPGLIQRILDKMDYIFCEEKQNSLMNKRVFISFEELNYINEPVTVIFLGLGPMRFQENPLGRKLYSALGDKLVERLDPINALCAELIIKHCLEITHPFFRVNRQPKISFVILSGLNNVRVLDEMLASFCAKTPPKSDIEVIIVINGSTDESAKVPHIHLKKQYNYRVIYLPENVGVACGYNEGIALARGKYICLLQDDVLFEQKDWHRELSFYLDTHPEIGIIGGQQARFYFRLPKSHHTFEHPYIDIGSDNWTPLSKFLVKVDAALCMAVMFRKKLGFYDERFLPNSLEDIAFCFKARKEGWAVYATQVGIKHEFGGARGITHGKNDNFTDKTRRLLKKLLVITDDLNSGPKKAVARRLSRAYHYQLFTLEYGDMLRELPVGQVNITLDEIEKNIETLPKNYQRRE